jgi:hypothetical protein
MSRFPRFTFSPTSSIAQGIDGAHRWGAPAVSWPLASPLGRDPRIHPALGEARVMSQPSGSAIVVPWASTCLYSVIATTQSFSCSGAGARDDDG